MTTHYYYTFSVFIQTRYDRWYAWSDSTTDIYYFPFCTFIVRSGFDNNWLSVSDMRGPSSQLILLLPFLYVYRTLK